MQFGGTVTGEESLGGGEIRALKTKQVVNAQERLEATSNLAIGLDC